jgi:hypothetical protein
VKVADGDMIIVREYPFRSRRKLPGSGNHAHAPGVYLSGKRNSSGGNEHEKEIHRQLVGWYGSGSGGIRGFGVLPGKNDFNWSCRDKVYLGQGWVPDYLYLGIINVKRPMLEPFASEGRGRKPRPFCFRRRERLSWTVYSPDPSAGQDFFTV